MPPEPVFFLDRAMSARRVVEALQEAGAVFHRHDDSFPQNTLDTDWLPHVGQQGWFVITQDLRIRYNPLEKKALLENRVGAFILVGKNLSGAGMAECVRRALPKMTDLARQQPRPFIAKVYADGRVLLLAVS